MSTDAASCRDTLTRFEQLRMGREIIRAEARALRALAARLDDLFCQAVEMVLACRGNLIVTGMGKAGLIGQKIAATLASTGTSAHFLHPGEAVHGDLGRIHPLDNVLALSMSGETHEVTRLIPCLTTMAIPLLAITGHPGSALGRAARVTLDLGPLREAGALGLAPSTSTTAMLALGDALALVVSRCRQFNAGDFARFHPGGSLGRKLAKVEEVMRPLNECRVAEQSRSVREVLVRVSRPGRRTGAIMLVDADLGLQGLFTDSDLARILEQNQDNALDLPIQQVMTRQPATVRVGTLLTEAIELLATRKISELPVVDAQGKPVGLIDITDVVGQSREVWGPEAAHANDSADWRSHTVRFPNS
ncbi:MAG: KpsF/GutQ family sugar-phosphate isomerase [Pirellulaceae bacterium]